MYIELWRNVICNVMYLQTSFTIIIIIILIELNLYIFLHCYYYYYDGVYGYQSINQFISIMTMDISPINKKTS